MPMTQLSAQFSTDSSKIFYFLWFCVYRLEVPLCWDSYTRKRINECIPFYFISYHDVLPHKCVLQAYQTVSQCYSYWQSQPLTRT